VKIRDIPLLPRSALNPVKDTGDVSNLLGRAGFKLLTVDIEDVTVTYPSIFELMQDLRDMGEGNAVVGRYAAPFSVRPTLTRNSRHLLRRDTLIAAAAAYQGNLMTDRVIFTNIRFSIAWK